MTIEAIVNRADFSEIFGLIPISFRMMNASLYIFVLT